MSKKKIDESYGHEGDSDVMKIFKEIQEEDSKEKASFDDDIKMALLSEGVYLEEEPMNEAEFKAALAGMYNKLAVNVNRKHGSTLTGMDIQQGFQGGGRMPRYHDSEFGQRMGNEVDDVLSFHNVLNDYGMNKTERHAIGRHQDHLAFEEPDYKSAETRPDWDYGNVKEDVYQGKMYDPKSGGTQSMESMRSKDHKRRDKHLRGIRDMTDAIEDKFSHTIEGVGSDFHSEHKDLGGDEALTSNIGDLAYEMHNALNDAEMSVYNAGGEKYHQYNMNKVKG